MSDYPEEARRGQGASSSSSSNGAALQPTTSAGSDDKTGTPLEKTISCVSCRKRKLKCDRVKPKCGTCSRLRHECEYPDRRRNPGSKRRNMKELEARLAQVENQLVAETSKNTPPKDTPPLEQNAEPEWNDYPVDINMEFEEDVILDFSVQETAYSFPPSIPNGDFFSQDVIALGLEESLPPDEMMADLHQIFFEKVHSMMPMIHKGRYFAGLRLPAHMRPPISLRYAIWANAASLSEKYVQYDDMLYERARKYIERAEMKGLGETFVTIQHAQAWCLIGTYEAKKTFFTRAWMSTGRMVRLCQMLGLHSLDQESGQQDGKRILPPPKDWIELEERRRTFWGAFYGDRWASSGTGWPMIIDEKTISTNLPVSEECFELGIMESSISLQEALMGEGASRISSFGGVVLSASLFGHNFEHLRQRGPDELPEDLSNGEFWKRHRKMDNVLVNTFMFLPDHLRLPGGLRDMNVVFLHMNIHASTICLHQAAVVTAERNKVSKTFIRQSRARSLMAAEEITNIMKLISHLDVSTMNSWMGFCLYVASGVFIQDQRSEERSQHSMTNLDFLVAAMKAIGKKHSITEHFTAQVELDIESSGIGTANDGIFELSNDSSKHIPMHGLLPRSSISTRIGEGETCPHNSGSQLTHNLNQTLIGIHPSNEETAQPGSYNVTRPGVQTQLTGNLRESSNATVLNQLAGGQDDYSRLPGRSQGSSSRESQNSAITGNFTAQLQNSTILVDAPFNPNVFETDLWSPSNFINDKDSPETQNSSSTGQGPAQTPAILSPSNYPFEMNVENQYPINSSSVKSASSAPAMAADSVMTMQTFLSGNPASFSTNQIPYRQGGSSRHTQSEGVFQSPPHSTKANVTENTSGWSFEPKLPSDLCQYMSDLPNDGAFQDPAPKWNDNQG